MKPVDPSLESFNSEVIYFLLCTVSWILKSISVTRPINRADLHLILYSNAKCKMIYSFVDRSPGLHFICYQVDASLYLGRFFDIVKICILQNGK